VAKVGAEHGRPSQGTSLTLADVLAAETWARATTAAYVKESGR